MQFYFGILAFLFVIFGYILFLNDSYDFNFGKGLFLSVVIIFTLMSIFSLLNIMNIGFWITTLFGWIYFIFSNMLKIKNKQKLFKIINCPSFLFFIFFLVIFTFAAKKVTILMNWDECSYWATMVKRLFYFNSYVGGNNFHTMYYPPALTSYNYYVVRFLGMQDSSIYFAQYFCMFSGIIFFVKNIKWDQLVTGIMAILSTFMFLILLLNPFILTLYSEIPLIMFLSIASLLLFTRKEKMDLFFVAMMLFNATLIKSNGIVACIAICFMALGQLISITYNNYLKEKKSLKTIIKTIIKEKNIIIVIISPLIAHFSFNLYLNYYSISNPQSLGENGIKSFFTALFVKNENTEIIYKYFNALNSNYNYSTFNLSSMLLISMIIIGFIVLKNIYDSTDDNINNNTFFPFACLTGFFVYVFTLLYSYLFMFSKFEASILASFDRYINTFIGGIGLGLLGVIIFYLFPNHKKIKNKMHNYFLIIFLLIIATININDVYIFSKNVVPWTEPSTVVQIESGKEISRKYQRYFSNDDKIHLIIQGDYGLTVWSTIYYMTPLKLYDPRFDGDFWSIRTPKSEYIENTNILSPENYIQFLKDKNFTHVLVIKSSDEFSVQYNSVFETNKEKYIAEGIYVFDKEKEVLVFKK